MGTLREFRVHPVVSWYGWDQVRRLQETPGGAGGGGKKPRGVSLVTIQAPWNMVLCSVRLGQTHLPAWPVGWAPESLLCCLPPAVWRHLQSVTCTAATREGHPPFSVGGQPPGLYPGCSLAWNAVPLHFQFIRQVSATWPFLQDVFPEP